MRRISKRKDYLNFCFFTERFSLNFRTLILNFFALNITYLSFTSWLVNCGCDRLHLDHDIQESRVGRRVIIYLFVTHRHTLVWSDIKRDFDTAKLAFKEPQASSLEHLRENTRVQFLRDTVYSMTVHTSYLLNLYKWYIVTVLLIFKTIQSSSHFFHTRWLETLPVWR